MVRNPNSLPATNQPIFTISNLPPTVTGIAPSSGVSGQTVSITDLVGTGFRSGATVTLLLNGQTRITAGNVVVVSPSRITCNLRNGVLLIVSTGWGQGSSWPASASPVTIPRALSTGRWTSMEAAPPLSRVPYSVPAQASPSP